MLSKIDLEKFAIIGSTIESMGGIDRSEGEEEEEESIDSSDEEDETSEEDALSIGIIDADIMIYEVKMEEG